MKKNILLLINGFGIEQPGSYDIYSPELMPNLDKLTKEKLFTSLTSLALEYKGGYQTFSIGINEPLTYSIIEKNISAGTHKTNQLLQYIASQLNQFKSKLHIFCYWDNNNTLAHLTEFLRTINLYLPDTKIIIHLIFTQKSLSAYKNMANTLTMVNYDLAKNVSIGMVTGEHNLSKALVFKDYIKCWITESGEKWKDVSKKIDVLVETKTLPNVARTFSISEGIRLEENDQILFFNYSSVDVTSFAKELEIQKYRNIKTETIKYYSLFPTKSDKPIPFMYNFAVSSSYALNSLKTINAKCVILDEREKCSYINYYMTGLRNLVDPSLRYIATDGGVLYDTDKVVEIVKSCSEELIIINYEIDSCKNIEEIEKRLNLIDDLIGKIETFTNENNYGFFISSLYGIEKNLYNQKNELSKVNFSARVPFIVSDRNLPKANNTISEGTVYDMANTIYSNISSSFKGSSLVKKKSSLLSILYKKKKEEK
ncbi:MAG: hypothetical protein GX758_04225 [Tenericutes bacterium]|nr:hypothetical protein [Mycoplasmatota bacterium]